MTQLKLADKSLREKMREASNFALAIDQLCVAYAFAWNHLMRFLARLIVKRTNAYPIVRKQVAGSRSSSRFEHDLNRVVKHGARKSDDFSPTVFSMAQKADYPVSDRVQIVTLEIAPNAPIGRIWIYLFPDEKQAKPVFMVDDSQVRVVVGVKRYYVAPVAWDPVDGEEGIDKLKHQLAAQMQDMVNKKWTQYHKLKAQGKVPHQELKLQAARAVKLKPAAEPKEQPAERASAKQHAAMATPAPVPAVAPVAAPVVQATAPVAPPPAPAAAAPAPAPARPVELAKPGPNGHVGRMVQGQSWTGYVAEMGMVDRPGTGGTTYETFCLKIDVNRTHLPFYGVELQRELMERRARPGDKVELVFMGTAPVLRGEGQKPMWKNLYKITVLEKGSQP
jgi:hypothetical protein